MSEAAMNPYQSGNYEPARSVGEPSKRPVGLLIFCVLILTLASMGFMGNVFGAVMLAINGGKVDYKQQFGANANIDINPEALNKMQAFGPTHATRNIGITIAGLFASSILIIGSIAAIYPFRWGPGLLTFGCVVAILFLVAQGVVVMMMTQEILGILKEYPDNFFIPKGDIDENAIGFMNSFMRGMYIAIPIVTWVFNGLKTVFYLSVMAYLRKTNVRNFVLGATR